MVQSFEVANVQGFASLGGGYCIKAGGVSGCFGVYMKFGPGPELLLPSLYYTVAEAWPETDGTL